MTPLFNEELHIVSYRGNKIVLKPKIGRRTRFIGSKGKERLSIKLEAFHFSFTWRTLGFPADVRQIQGCPRWEPNNQSMITNQGSCVFWEDLYLTYSLGSNVIATNLNLSWYTRYDINMHSKCVYPSAVLVIITSDVHNANDMLRDTPFAEFGSIKKKHLCNDAWQCVVQLADYHVQAREKYSGSGAHAIKKNESPNSRGYCRPRPIRIRGRFGPEPMHVFVNSQSRILAEVRIWYPALHENRHSPQKLLYRRNFVRRFRICNHNTTHDSSPQSWVSF